MKKLKPQPAEKAPLPIDWNKSPTFKMPLLGGERQRLAALHRYDILDTPPEKTFDSITVLASHVCQTPIALLVLIDEDSQWFKAKVSVRFKETPDEFAFCAYTITQHEPFNVPDVVRDKLFVKNPLGTSNPKYRFYAGAPLITADNRVLGTLCVMDYVRRVLTVDQKKDLLALSQLVMEELEHRRSLRPGDRGRHALPPHLKSAHTTPNRY